jgi:hypothetical protein
MCLHSRSPVRGCDHSILILSSTVWIHGGQGEEWSVSPLLDVEALTIMRSKICNRRHVFSVLSLSCIWWFLYLSPPISWWWLSSYQLYHRLPRPHHIGAITYFFTCDNGVCSWWIFPPTCWVFVGSCESLLSVASISNMMMLIVNL